MAVKLSVEDQKLKETSVEEITEWYKDGDITLLDKNQLLRDKAQLRRREHYQEGGYVDAVTKQFVQNMTESWNTLVDVATRTEGTWTNPSKSAESGGVGSPGSSMAQDIALELWHSGRAIWAMMSMIPIISIPTAFGQVHAEAVKSKFLEYGAPPGLAWIAGVIADVGTNIVSVQGVARSLVKTAQKGGARIAGAMAGDISNDAKFVGQLSQALTKDGVPNAETFVTRISEQATGRTLEKDALAKAIADAAKPVEQSVAPQISFLDRAGQFASQISKEDARKELPALMKKFGISYPDLKMIKDVWAGQKSMSAEKFYGYLKAMEAHANELGDLARAAVKEGATDVEKMAFVKSATELFTGPQAKPGYTSEFLDLLIHWDPASMAKGDITGAMTAFAKDMSMVSARDAMRMSYQNQDSIVRFGYPFKYIREMFVNSLLPFANAAAALGNSIGVSTMVAERLAAGHPIQAAGMVKGMALATGDALRAWKMSYQTSAVRRAIPGDAGQIINIPADTMVGIDMAGKVIAMRGSLYADAIEATAGLGFGAARGTAIQAFMAAPPRSAIEMATERAYRATYQNDLGNFADQLRKVSQSAGYSAGSAYFLFWKSPINLVKWGWDRTPGIQMVSGRLWHDILQGGTAAEDAVGRLTISNLSAMMFWELAKEGTITGSGPADPTLRKAWLATHEPYSIRTSSGWIPYSNIDPITMPVALVADLAQLADQIDEDSLGQGAMAAAFAFMHEIADRTHWRTLSDMVDVGQGIHDAKRLSKHNIDVVAGPAGTTLTGGAFGQRTAKVLDPVQRDARDFIGGLSARTPWDNRVIPSSPHVPPRRDAYGDPIIPPQSMGPAWFGYFSPLVPKIKPESTDRIKVEGARLQVKTPNYPDYIGNPPPDNFDITQALPGDKIGVDLTPDQRDRWQQLARNIIRSKEFGLEAMMDSHEYNFMPNGEATTPAFKRQMFSDFLSTAKNSARSLLIADDPELAKRIMGADLKQVKPLLDEQNRAQVTKDFEQLISIYDGLSESDKHELSKWGLLEPDQPYTQPGVTIGGVEVLGPRTYTPKEHLFDTSASPALKEEMKRKSQLPIPGLPSPEPPKTGITVTSPATQ